MALAAPRGRSSQQSAQLVPEHQSLNSLLERARKLQSSTQDAASTSILPSVDLGLDQIESSSRALAARAQHELGAGREGPSTQNARAQFLLASAQVNMDALGQTLDRLDPLHAFAPLQPLHDNDLEGLIRHAHESVIISAIEENRKQIVADFYRSLETSLHASWEREKLLIFDEIGRYSAGLVNNAKSDGQPIPSTTAVPADSTTPQAPGFNARLRRYEQVVAEINGARQRSQDFDVVEAFANATRQSVVEGKNSRLLSAWQLIGLLVRDERAGEVRPLPRHAFSQARCAPDDAHDAIEMRTALTRGSLAYLEEHFLINVLEKELADKANQAHIGGIPSIAKKVEAYTRLQGGRARWPSIELFKVDTRDEALWSTIFFLLRSGHARQAVEYAQQYEDKLRTSSPDFLPKAEHEMMANFYIAHLHHSSSADPFKLALHKILARADLAKKRLPAVTERTEDWFWLQLVLTQEGSRSITGERWSLIDLGRTMSTRYTAETFGGAYFHLLMLAGQFELAVAHLYARPQQQLDAVHLAVALAYYGLLRIPSEPKASDVDIVTQSADGHYAIDFNRLIYRHYRTFSLASPQVALQYICLLPLVRDPASNHLGQYKVVQTYVRDLVIDTRAYTLLLGGLNGEGMHEPGAIQGCVGLLTSTGEDPHAFVRSLIREVARRAETDKSFATAIELYNLADEAENVMRVLNTELGRVLARPVDSLPISSQNTMLQELAQQDPFAAAKALVEYYSRGRGGQNRPSAVALSTCDKLLKLRQAFIAARAGQLTEGLEAIRATDLIPLTTSDITLIMRKAEDAKIVDEAIARNYGEVLLTAMTLLFQLHNQLKDSIWSEAGRSAKMDEFRMQARSLMTFAGMLRFRLPNNVFEQLTRLSVFLH